jgi:hypothetical protein
MFGEGGHLMGPTFEQQLKAIAWEDYHTAYGPAVTVPDQLRRLAGPDRDAALKAIRDLDGSICHQHVQLWDAAVPALPFLLEVLDGADSDLTVGLLKIMLGYATGVNQERIVASWRKLGRAAPPELPWVAALRAALLAELPRFRQLAASSDKEVARRARWVVSELGAGSHAEPGARLTPPP